MKKLSKILFTLVFVFLFAISVHAVTITTNSTAGTVDTASRQVTNTGTISVTNVGTDTFKTYKVVDAFYNSTTNNVTYEFTSTFKTYLNSTNGQNPDYHSLTVDQYMALVGSSTSAGVVPASSSTLDALMSGYAQYIRTNNTTATGTMTTSGGTASITTAVGAYLILPNTTSDVYSVMVGNVKLTASNNTWTVEGTSIAAKKSSPAITKYHTSYKTTTCTSQTYDGTNCRDNAGYNIGEEHSYTITATIPTYPADAINKTLTITDTLASGLDFKGIGYVTIKDGATTLTISSGNIKNGSNVTVGTASISGRTLTVTLDVTKLTSTTVEITPVAKLNSNATAGSSGNLNTATMTYAKEPYKTGNGTTATKSDTTKAYTYGITINKTDSADNTVTLNGAQYELYSSSSCTGTAITTMTTANTGTVTYKGVKPGTYYLKEVVAPAGYRLDSTCQSVTVTTSSTNTTKNLTDVAQGLLPDTGGIGTYIYMAVGAILIIGSLAFVVILSKKKDDKDDETKKDE